MKDLSDIIKAKKLIAVLTLNDISTALPIAKALYEGGISAIELTLRTPIALEAIKQIKTEYPEMLVAAGTVLKPEQIDDVIKSGADFAVSPGTNPRVLKAAKEAGLFFGPGIMTPSDIETALEFDCTLLKYFPAGTSGGMAHLKAMSAPYNHLGVSFIPLGGVNMQNLEQFLSDPLIAAVGGSWLATPKQIQEKNYEQIKIQAQEASSIINK